MRFNNQKKPKTTIPKIFDGKYYEHLTEALDIDGNINPKCLTCNNNIKGNLSTTGNYYTHYRLKHPSLHPKLKLHSKTKNDKKESKQPTIKEAIAQTSDVRNLKELVALYLNIFIIDLWFILNINLDW